MWQTVFKVCHTFRIDYTLLLVFCVVVDIAVDVLILKYLIRCIGLGYIKLFMDSLNIELAFVDIT